VTFDAEDVLEIQLAKTLILNKQLFGPMFLRHGVETYQWHALLRLWQEDGLSQVELGSLMLRDKVAITRLVAEIEAKGLVERRPDPIDSRVKRVYLTAKARKMIPRAHAEYVQMCKQAHRPLSPRMRKELSHLLGELRRGYREAIDELAEESRSTA
jgi:DNA-binding MarR family transcriptional regulator